MLAGVLGVSYAAVVIFYGEAYQAIELRKFEHAEPLAEPHLLNLGEVIGEIQIPRLGVKAVVIQGDAPNSWTVRSDIFRKLPSRVSGAT